MSVSIKNYFNSLMNVEVDKAAALMPLNVHFFVHYKISEEYNRILLLLLVIVIVINIIICNFREFQGHIYIHIYIFTYL